MPYEKVGKNEPVCIADEVPFEIPDSWEWVRLGSIGETNIGLTYKPADICNSGIGVLRSNNIQNGMMDYSDLIYVSCDVPPRAMAQKGDILICARNGSRALVGKSAIVDRDGIAFGAFMAIFRSICNPYIQLFINSYLFRGQLDGATTTTINQVTQSMLRKQLCPLPPLEEQKRIVKKYNELLPLITKYEKVYTATTKLQNDFPAQLKRSILQWAVQGKLVPQDPSDEPAEALVERIRAEKLRLIKEGKIKQDKHESVIFRRDNSHYENLDGIERSIDNEIPFDLPESWEWVRLGYLLKVESGKPLTSKEMKHGTIPVYGGNGITGYHNRYLVNKETVVIGRVGYYCGSVYITEPKAWVTDNAFITSYPTECIDRDYLVFTLRSMNLGHNNNATAQPVVSGKKIYPKLFPLPPFAEQKRIATKLKEILPLCKII